MIIDEPEDKNNCLWYTRYNVTECGYLCTAMLMEDKCICVYCNRKIIRTEGDPNDH